MSGLPFAASAALARAAAGLYRSSSFRSPRAELSKPHWFVPSGDQLALVPAAREGVSFRRGNAVDPEVLRGAPAYDVIFCRNLLIYFDEARRQRVADALHDALRDGGYLCLGHSESMSRISARFQVRKFTDAIVYQKAQRS